MFEAANEEGEAESTEPRKTGPTVDKDDIREEVATPTEAREEYTIVVTDGDETARFAAETQSVVMQEAIVHLIEERDLLGHISLPYRTNGKQAILAPDPYHPDGADMRNPYEVTGEAYVETGIDKWTKQRYLGRLADECDVDVLFGPEWGGR